MDWDDLRVFLAVARDDGLSRAGRRLGMDPSTVGRRVARLEQALGRALFAPRSKGPVWLGLILYLALGGFLESGLFDSSVSFMVFLVAALGVFETGHQRPSTAEPAGRPMAEAMSAGSGSAIVAS